MTKKKGPLADFGSDTEPSVEDAPLDAGQMPEDIEEKVLEEIGSLQFKAIMNRLDEMETKLDMIFVVVVELKGLVSEQDGKKRVK